MAQVNEDQYFAGRVTMTGQVSFPPGSIGNTQISPSDPFQAPNMQHRFAPRVAQAFGAAAVADRRVVHRARAPGVLTAFAAGLTVANVGAATITFDVLKNGVTMLAAPVVLTSATPAFGSVLGGILALGAYATGDVIEVTITVAAGGGTLGQGAFGEPVLTEAA